MGPKTTSHCADPFQTLLERTGLGFVSLDLQARVAWSNRAFAAMLGHAEDQMRGKHICDFTHPDDRKLVLSSLNELSSGNSEGFCAERRYLHKDGNIVFARVTVSPVRNSAGELQSLAAMVEDVTAQRRLETEFRKLSHAVEQSSASIVLTDTEGRIEYVNKKFTDLTGYTAKEVMGKNPRVLKSGELSKENYRNLWQTIKAGKEWRGEFHNRKKNGDLFWEWASLSPVFDNSGQITHFLAVKEDITGRKELESQLTETLAFNRRIFSNAPVGILAFDHTGRCIMANAAAARSVNATASELLQQNFRKLESWQSSGMLRMAEETLADQQARTGTFNILTTFGKEAWLTCHFSCVKRFKRDCLLLIFDDVTENMKAGEKIREQAALLDQVPDAILLLDEDHRITFWNRGAERIYGWAAAEVLGKHPHELFQKGVVTPELQVVIDSVVNHGAWSGEMTEFTKSGKAITVEKRNFAIRDSKGRYSVLIINTDITKRKELETQLFRTERLESLGTLASGIAHDLNNVLTPILFSVQLLKQENSEDERVKLIDVLQTNLHRATNLIKQVLTFGRGTQGERILFEPSKVIRDVQQMVAETFPKTIERHFEVPGNLWQILGNPTQIYQVMLNLCINARDAMTQEGTLSIRVENFMLDTTLSGLSLEAPPGPYVVFHISDSGTGISKEVQDRMFDPFYTTKPVGKGTGLGLSTTLGIVKGHGGFIKCYSELGKGTHFQVFFPAQKQEQPSMGLSQEPSVPRGNDELILFVDDEQTIRDISHKMLAHYGYKVLVAQDGAEALSIYSRFQTDIAAVITDMDMPVMSGGELIAELRKSNPRLPIIGCSGLPLEETRHALDRFVLKPYSAQTLLTPLRALLRAASRSSDETRADQSSGG